MAPLRVHRWVPLVTLAASAFTLGRVITRPESTISYVLCVVAMGAGAIAAQVRAAQRELVTRDRERLALAQSGALDALGVGVLPADEAQAARLHLRGIVTVATAAVALLLALVLL